MTKKSVKKLVLHKESLHRLEHDRLEVVAGGISGTTPCLSDRTQCTFCSCQTCFC